MLDHQFWLALGVILTAAAAWLGHRMMRPKILAEAKKAIAEADSMDWTRFQAEIDRLERKIAAQDDKIAAMERDRVQVAAVADEREAENRSLRLKLGKLEKRLSAIEALFKAHPIPAAMQAALDQLDRDN